VTGRSPMYVYRGDASDENEKGKIKTIKAMYKLWVKDSNRITCKAMMALFGDVIEYSRRLELNIFIIAL
jgi:hypothetical protein